MSKSRGIVKKSAALASEGTFGKLSQKMIEDLGRLLTVGNSKKAAAAALGVTAGTITSWGRQAQEVRLSLQEGLLEECEMTQRQRLLLKLEEEMLKAEARAEVWHLSNIRSAAEGDWKASAWWLERARPQAFGKQSRVEHTGSGGGPIKIQPVPIEAALKEMTDDELKQLQAIEVRARRSISSEEGGG